MATPEQLQRFWDAGSVSLPEADALGTAMDLELLRPSPRKGELRRIRTAYAGAFNRLADVYYAEPGPEPEPDPAPQPAPAAVLSGFGGTYSGHGLARDCYLGTDPEMVAWGPHHGIDLLAPAPGRVELYQFGTPLAGAAASDREYQQRHHALFDGWVCSAQRDVMMGGRLFGAQTMFVAVYWPDDPRRVGNGQVYRAAGAGHCRSDVPVGRVNAGDRWATTWDSGVRFEGQGLQVRAAHVHLTGFTGQLSPNGDIDGLLVAEDLGLQVRNVGIIAGPNDYLAGSWIAGRPKREWAGRALPPMPEG